MDMVKDRIDPVKAKNGAPFKLDKETTFQVRRWNNAEYRTRLLELREEYVAKHNLDEDEKLPDEVSKDIMAKAMSEFIVVGWEGLKSDGEVVEYSSEIAYQFLSDEGFEDQMYRIINAASNRDHFLSNKLDKRTKKS